MILGEFGPGPESGSPKSTQNPAIGEDALPYEQLIVDRDGAVASVRLNNPAKLNALSETMTRELIDALEGLAGDPAVRAIVLTGEGRGFCSGADLGGMADEYRGGGRARPSDLLDEGYAKVVRLVVGAPKPVIAAVNGVAAGAGLSLALACDLRIASEAATFSMAFVRIGLVPDSGASYFLPRIVGAAAALELSITGERIDAERALRMGLVSRLAPADALQADAAALAAELAALPTQAIGLTKQLLRDAASLSLDEALALESRVQDTATQTEDHREGVLAFLDKRTPEFRGR
jgi:2-(1,2-epoxy-1,2-dihydrophenyl)acetyl-CoA isomerase